MPRYWGERISAVVFILLAIYIGDMAREFPAGGGTFPLFAAGGVVVLSLLIIMDSFIGRDPERSAKIRLDFSYSAMKPVFVTAAVIVYVIAIFELGYFVSSALFLIGTSMMVGIRNPRTIVLTAVILFPVMYVFFEIFLHASLPQGLLI